MPTQTGTAGRTPADTVVPTLPSQPSTGRTAAASAVTAHPTSSASPPTVPVVASTTAKSNGLDRTFSNPRDDSLDLYRLVQLLDRDNVVEVDLHQRQHRQFSRFHPIARPVRLKRKIVNPKDPM